MKLPDCQVYVATSESGEPFQLLVPHGASVAEAAAAQKVAISGKLEWQGVVLGEALHRLVAWKEQPAGTDREKCLAVYEVYPRKAERPSALAAIRKALAKVPYEVLLDRTAKYAAAVAEWPERDKAFVPYAQRWFNQERYSEDMATWERSSSKDAVPDHSKGF